MMHAAMATLPLRALLRGGELARGDRAEPALLPRLRAADQEPIQFTRTKNQFTRLRPGGAVRRAVGGERERWECRWHTEGEEAAAVGGAGTVQAR